MRLLVDFLSNLAKQAEGFSMNVNKLVDNFERDLKYDKPNRDTTGICIRGLPGRIRTINEIFASHLKIAQLQAIESLDNFSKTYHFRTNQFLQEANKYRVDLKNVERNIEKSQTKYYKMCKKREKSEQEIEKAIQDHEKGNLTFAQVQK